MVAHSMAMQFDLAKMEVQTIEAQAGEQVGVQDFEQARDQQCQIP